MKTILFLTFVTLSTIVQADNKCGSGITISRQSENLLRLAKKVPLSHWSASKKQIRNKKCDEQVPSTEEINSYIDNKFRRNNHSEKIYGSDFENEDPLLLAHFKDLMTKRTYLLENKDPKNQVDLQDKFDLNPGCKKVKCAMDKIFGEELGNKILLLKTKYDLNSSEYGNGASSRLKVSEINNLIKSAQSFPETTFPIEKNKAFFKFKRKARGFGPRVLANAVISFFDTWSGYGPEIREYASFHELSHYIGGQLDIDDSPEWLSFSGWEKKGEKWEATKDSTFSSKYGMTNPHEDFAESVSAYRYNPESLKGISPDKYQYIKEIVFHGLEYTNDNKCSMDNSYLNNLPLAESSPTTSEDKSKELLSVVNGCADEVVSLIINSPNSRGALDQCLITEDKKLVINQKIDNMNLKYPQYVKMGIQQFGNNEFIDLNLDINQKNETNQYRRYIRREVVNKMIEEKDDKKSLLRFIKPSKVCGYIWDYFYYDLFKKGDTTSSNPISRAFSEDQDSNKFIEESKKSCIAKGKEGMSDEDVKSIFSHVSSLNKNQEARTIELLKIYQSRYKTAEEEYNQLGLIDKVTHYSSWNEKKTYLNGLINELKEKLYN